MSRFDRDFDSSWRMHSIFMGVIFTIVVVVFVAQFVGHEGYLAYKGVQVIEDPKGSADAIGQIIREFEKGYNK